MADIESMYYQLRVTECQQTFIKFLWWENHNIEEEPSGFAMCAHVFGGILSASCSNYALKELLQTVEGTLGLRLHLVL